jgi:uncharacterized protein (TIGR02996 family)
MAKKRVSPHERAFLDEICSHPEDDAARLVYADWLDERGQPHRAEFIRTQVQLATMGIEGGAGAPPYPPGPEDAHGRHQLEQREWELLTAFRDEWREVLPAWAREAAHEFRRGFIAYLRITAMQFMRYARTLFRTVPIQGLHLRALGAQLPEVVASPFVKQLTSLDLASNRLGEHDLKALTSSPHLDNLTELSLPHTVAGNNLRALAGWQQLSCLRRLDLTYTELDAEVLRSLVAFDLHALTWLNLSQNRPGLTGMQLLGSSSNLRNLRHLDLGWCEIDAESLAALVHGKGLPHLASLDLTANRPLGRSGLRTLVTSPLARQLTHLTLSRVSNDPGTFAGLLLDHQLKRLRHLALQHVPTGVEGAAALAEAGFDSLVTLDLSSAQLGAEGSKRLAQSPTLGNLQHLDLTDNQIGDAGARALAASPYLTNLRRLDLGDNDIGPEGIAALAASPILERVEELSLDSNLLGTSGVRALASSPSLRNLRKLNLNETDLDSEAILILAEGNFPELRKLTLVRNYLGSPEAWRAVAHSPRFPHLLVLDVCYHLVDSSWELRQYGREIKV